MIKSILNIPETPEFILPPKSRRIKTLVKHCTQTKEFDAVVNAAVADGWTLDEIRTINNQSSIMLFALLHRYETETDEEKTFNEKRAEIGLPPIEQKMSDIIRKELKEYHENKKTSGAGGA